MSGSDINRYRYMELFAPKTAVNVSWPYKEFQQIWQNPGVVLSGFHYCKWGTVVHWSISKVKKNKNLLSTCEHWCQTPSLTWCGWNVTSGQLSMFNCSLLFSDMESAIKTLVTTFLSYTKGKENLDTKTFKKMVQQQFGSVMEVRTRECQTPNSTKTKQNNICLKLISLSRFLACPMSRTRTARLPLRRCSRDWMRTAMERSASRNT